MASRIINIDAPSPLTLTDAVFPRPMANVGLQNAFLIIGSSLLIAAGAQVAIHLPWTPVPITGQTFGVLLTGILLGRKRGAAAVALYLLEGASGLPVFAGGTAGLASFVGPTAGYLFAFPIAAFVVGWLAERGWDRKPLTAALAMLLGSLVILGLGSALLSVLLGSAVLGFTKGFAPFLVGDLVKTATAAALLPTAWHFMGKRNRQNNNP